MKHINKLIAECDGKQNRLFSIKLNKSVCNERSLSSFLEHYTEENRYLGGFIRDEAVKYAGAPFHKLTNNAASTAVASAWQQRAEAVHLNTLAYKVAVKLDSQFEQLLTLCNAHTVEHVLLWVICELDAYQASYYPGDRLGYVIGHGYYEERFDVQIRLFPLTEKGGRLTLTNDAV